MDWVDMSLEQKLTLLKYYAIDPEDYNTASILAKL
jgi:hypothetical protein